MRYLLIHRETKSSKHLKCQDLVIFHPVKTKYPIIKFAREFEFVNVYSFTTFLHFPSPSWSLRITAPAEVSMSMLALEPTFLLLLNGRTEEPANIASSCLEVDNADENEEKEE